MRSEMALSAVLAVAGCGGEGASSDGSVTLDGGSFDAELPPLPEGAFCADWADGGRFFDPLGGPGAGGRASGIATDGTGGALVVGTTEHDDRPVLIRLSPDGARRDYVDPGSYTETALTTVTFTPEGGAFVGGRGQAGEHHVLESDGSPECLATLARTGTTSPANTQRLLVTDAHLYVAATGGSRTAMHRFGRDCEPDPTFRGDGVVSLSFGGGDVSFATAARQWTFVSAASPRAALARYDEGGHIDASFGEEGIVYLDRLTATSTIVDRYQDGRLVVAFANAVADRTTLIRIDPETGAIDETFGDGGSSIVDGDARDILVDGEDRTWVVTTADDEAGSNAGRLARIDAAGAPDMSFGEAGVIAFDGDTRVVDLALRSDGRVLVAGMVWREGYQGMLVLCVEP